METVIDWSKAPESATHYQKSDDNYAFRWLDMNAGEYGAVWAAGDWHLKSSSNDDSCIVPRPSHEWTGEGLPPVGTVCDAKHDYCVALQRVIVKYASETHVIVERDSQEFYFPRSIIILAPIRTPEQIAVDEREKQVRLMLEEFEHTGSLTSYYEVCEGLYNAGYRKQVAP